VRRRGSENVEITWNEKRADFIALCALRAHFESRFVELIVFDVIGVSIRNILLFFFSANSDSASLDDLCALECKTPRKCIHFPRGYLFRAHKAFSLEKRPMHHTRICEQSLRHCGAFAAHQQGFF